VQAYAANHIIMTFGGDFHYEIAPEAFKNIDKLIKYVNAEQAMNGSNVNIFYSTPSCYLYALNKVDRVWTTKTDDFFPALKRYERHSNNILQATRQLNAFANLNQRNNIFILSETMGIVQHHDAITGTEREEVAFDYAQRLSDGIAVAEFTLILWNPTIHPVVQHVRVPVKTDYTIRDPTGQTVLSEVLEKKI
ncbi:unnamed protein product, partial [Rotaria sp. Silwood2]